MTRTIIALGLATLLAACGGGGGSGNTTTPEARTDVIGAGVKGPLSAATVRAYQVDTEKADMKGELLDEGETDSATNITGLSIPTNSTGLILIEFVANANTRDLTTGKAPTISQLQTVVPASRIINKEAIYATPLTTIAINVAFANADKPGVFGGDGGGSISVDELTAALSVAGKQVATTLGFGLIDASVDIFTVAPLLTDEAETVAEQRAILKYRMVIEATTAIVGKVQDDAESNNADTTLTDTTALIALAEDMEDVDIDGMNGASAVSKLVDVSDTAAIVTQDPSKLTIPGITTLVNDMGSILAEETNRTGVTVDTSALTDGRIVVTLKAPPDGDGDGVVDNADNCPSTANADQADNDNDGDGNACEKAIWDRFNWDGANWQ